LRQFRSGVARLQISNLLVFLALGLLYYNFWWKMQQERQGEIEHEASMEENAGPLLINKLEVQRQ